MITPVNKSVFDLNKEQISEIESRMRSRGLGEDESLMEVCERDRETLQELKVTYEQVASKLEELIKKSNLSETISDEKYEYKMTAYFGYNFCPFSDRESVKTYVNHRWDYSDDHEWDICGNEPTRYTIKRLDTGDTFTFSGLLPHLIRDHSILLDRKPDHYIDPTKLVRILELG